MTALIDLALFLAAALLSAGLIAALQPLFIRYALSRPNARSSHAVPTPQGGGVAVIAATIVTLSLAGLLGTQERIALAPLLPLAAGVVLLTMTGAVDDMVGIAPLPKLVLQALAVVAVTATMPDEPRVLPALPLAAERALEILAGLWLVNLTNFMDGIDGMTVAETVPITASIFIFSVFGAVPWAAGIAALALCGAIIGFAPFNRPVAKLFLGDVGSLPLGLILFWLLLQLAQKHPDAALLLPLYYVADASITLVRRLARGENITQAHRSHFYQLATARGLSVSAVIGRVFAANLMLAGLATVSIWQQSLAIDVAALALGSAIVAALLAAMSRGKR
jgi:UDP-N-acetylmuramyl pentapeptide phosphotransferase/UDP-N-acetylglucosamine-1-phosphate transferase